MKTGKITGWSGLGLLLGLGLALIPSSFSIGVEKAEQTAQSRDGQSSRELFEAISLGAIQARFIPQSAAQGVVYLENVLDEPIDLQLPAVFGAVHVLAQVGGGYGGGAFGAGGAQGGLGLGAGGLGAGGLGAGGQGLGGGFGGGAGLNGGAPNGGGLGAGGGGFGNGLGGGRGFFRVDPGKTHKLVVHTVCLEHGKPDPNPRMTYKLVPLEKVSSDPAIKGLCWRLGEGTVKQSVAQAAAWHLTNGLSWDELRLKNRHESKYTGNIRWFSAAELNAAWELSQGCLKERELTDSLADRECP